MKEGLRFVDSDMHVSEPADLLEKYLDPAFKSKVTYQVGASGKPRDFRGWVIYGKPSSMDKMMEEHRGTVLGVQAAGPFA